MRQARSLIVYGNCQAEAVSIVLQRCWAIAKSLRIVFCPDFDAPGQARTPLAAEDVQQCAIFWNQHTPNAFPYADQLPADCFSVSFPSIDLNLQWPFSCVNPYNEPLPPAFPWGPFPYGDRIVLECIAKGMAQDETLEYYLTRWDEYRLDMARLAQIESARLDARDAHCDVKMSSWVFENFRSRRLFWTVNHPTPRTLQELLQRLSAVSAKAHRAFKRFDPAATLRAHFPPQGPLGVANIPVHPRAAEELRLAWYDPNERYTVFARTYSYVEYFREMIGYCWRKALKPAER